MFFEHLSAVRLSTLLYCIKKIFTTRKKILRQLRLYKKEEEKNQFCGSRSAVGSGSDWIRNFLPDPDPESDPE
jgi:hypothetical protein